MEEINKLAELEGQEINEAKKILAYEVTKLVHGQEEADKAHKASIAAFESGSFAADIPTYTVSESFIGGGALILDLLLETKILPSKAEGRRLIQQNGLSLNDEKVTAIDQMITKDDFGSDGAIIKKGKKNFFKIIMD